MEQAVKIFYLVMKDMRTYYIKRRAGNNGAGC